MVKYEEDQVCFLEGSDNQIIIIDADDLAKVGHLNWSVLRSYSKIDGAIIRRYAVRVVNEQTILLHRVILGYDGQDDIDHINGNGLDNRKANLRVVSRTINNLNKEAGRIKTRYLVSGRTVYDARVGWLGGSIHIATLNTQLRAKVYAEAAVRDIINGAERIRGLRRGSQVWLHNDGTTEDRWSNMKKVTV